MVSCALPTKPHRPREGLRRMGFRLCSALPSHSQDWVKCRDRSVGNRSIEGYWKCQGSSVMAHWSGISASTAQSVFHLQGHCFLSKKQTPREHTQVYPSGFSLCTLTLFPNACFFSLQKSGHPHQHPAPLTALPCHCTLCRTHSGLRPGRRGTCPECKLTPTLLRIFPS